MEELSVARKQIKDRITNSGSSDNLAKLEQQVAELEGLQVRRGRGAASSSPTFGSIESSFAGLFGILNETDMPPTSQTVSGVAQTMAQLKELQAKWEVLKKQVAGTN